MLPSRKDPALLEAGCDEAGRGCLAGPVFAAAVILPSDFYEADLRDSKKIEPQLREELRRRIEEKAIAFSVSFCRVETIDRINILNASILAMHRAIKSLKVRPEKILVDGNRFRPYGNIPFECIIQGDDQIASIAAASILAKTYRDAWMAKLHQRIPIYGWNTNRGYPTAFHREAILEHGISDYHRKSFQLMPPAVQLQLF